MLISYQWLQEFFENKLPQPQELADILTMHAYEVEEIIEKKEDVLLDIDVLPNRAADSLSHLGIAREVAALLEQDFEYTFKDADTQEDLASADYIDLSVESTYVRRATKRVIMDVEVGDAPDHIKQRLQSLGHRCINNIVDLTNYVMLETGQPVHAFDYDKIAGDAPKKITIREAAEGEVVTTLDGDDFELSEGMLVIADDEKPLDIAGIKGGRNSGIDKDTKKVVLSVCSFDPTKIRTTSQSLNLRTDASKRFENDISPEMPFLAMKRLSALVAEYADGSVAEDILDGYPRVANEYRTGVKISHINDLLGADISQEETENILRRLGIEIEEVKPHTAVVEKARDFEGAPYTYGASVRFDAPDTFDCSSLASFLYAYYGGVSIPRISIDQYIYGTSVSKENIAPGDLIFSNSGDGKIYHESQEFLPGTQVSAGIDHVGIYLGEGEVIHASKSNGVVVVERLEESESFANIVGIRRIDQDPRLRAHVPYWRRDIRSEVDLIEEVGRVYGYDKVTEKVPDPTGKSPEIHKQFYYTQKIRDILVQHGFSEVYTYAFQPEGAIELKNPVAQDRKYLRSCITDGINSTLEENKKHEAILSGDEINVFEIGTVFTEDEEKSVIGIGSTKGTAVLDGAIEVLGKSLDLNESITEHCDVVFDNNAVEIDLDDLLDRLPQPSSYRDLKDTAVDTVYKPFSRFPYVLRDIAVWVPNEFSAEDLLSVITEAAGDLLVQQSLFDAYTPEGEGRTSYAFRLVFQSHEKTLSDDEVNGVMEDIYGAVEERGWEVR